MAPIQSPMPQQLRPTTYSMPRMLCPLPNPYSSISFAPNHLLPPPPNLHFSIRQHYPPMSFQPPIHRHSVEFVERYPRKNMGPPLVRPVLYPPFDRAFQRNDLDTFVPLQVARNSRHNANTISGSTVPTYRNTVNSDNNAANVSSLKI